MLSRFTEPIDPSEPHWAGAPVARLNSLRAAVLGAGDGIVSVAALVLGVAGATPALAPVITAGVAGLLAGALSMAAGEYVSVSAQRDTERALINKERAELAAEPEKELEELTELYQVKGLSRATAENAAKELTARDSLAAHAESELGITLGALVNPWQASIASALAFFAGGIIPIVAITLPPGALRVPTTFLAVIIALAITGWLSAKAGGAGRLRSMRRVITGGVLAMAVTYGAGLLFGIAGV